jgi:hypothetical protein
MSGFVYRVWFRDHDASPDEQDYEWVACFVVDAASDEEARGWGDHLARDYSRRIGHEEFLHSDVEPADDVAREQLPVIAAGYAATDGEIGW